MMGLRSGIVTMTKRGGYWAKCKPEIRTKSKQEKKYEGGLTSSEQDLYKDLVGIPDMTNA